MKLLAINSSHRGEKGLTQFLIQRLFAGAEEAGAECETVVLAKMKVNRCLSCFRCQTESPHLVCVYEGKDDVSLIFQKMAQADILIYATPIYLMNMSGLLKNFLDRTYSTMDIRVPRLSNGLIHHHINPDISSKPFVTLVVCGNLETASWKSVPAYFRTYAQFMEARQVGVLIRNASGLFDYPKNPQLGKDFPKIFEVCRAYEQAGRELATLGRIRRHTQNKANQEVIPLPFFSVLKNLRPIKRMILSYSKKL